MILHKIAGVTDSLLQDIPEELIRQPSKRARQCTVEPTRQNTPASRLIPEENRDVENIAIPIPVTSNRVHALSNISNPSDSDSAGSSRFTGRARLHTIPVKNLPCFKLASVFLRAKVYAENPWPSEAQKRTLILNSWKLAVEWRVENSIKHGIPIEVLTETVEPDGQTYSIVSCD